MCETATVRADFNQRPSGWLWLDTGGKCRLVFSGAASVSACKRTCGPKKCSVAEYVDAVCKGNNAEGHQNALMVSSDLSHAWWKSTPQQLSDDQIIGAFEIASNKPARWRIRFAPIV